MKFEEKIMINSTAKEIFKSYENVADWPTWDPDCKKAELSGPFKSGATGIIYPKGGPKSKLYFTDVKPDKSFEVECKLPLCVMKFKHELTESNGQTQVLHRVTFEGLLSPIFGRLIGSSLKKSLPHALNGLKKKIEKT
jgi:hypothetical protein